MKKHEFFVRERLPVPPIVLELLQQIPVVLKFANVYDAPTSRKTELYSALCTSWTGHAFLEDLVDDVLDPDFLGVEGLQLANETTDEVYGIVVVRKRDERLIIEALGTVQKSGWPLGTILLATTLHLAFHFHNYAIVKLATRFDTRAYYMYKRMGFVVTYEERNVVDMQLGNGNLSEETLRRLIEDRSFSNAQTDVIFFPTGARILVKGDALIKSLGRTIQEVGAINTTEYKDGHTAGERVKPFMNYPEYELLKKLGSGANATVWKAQSDDSVVVLRFSRYSEEQVPTKIIQTFLDRGITGKQMLDHHLIPIWVSIDVPTFKQYVTLMPYWEGENPEKIAEALAYPRNLEDLKAYLAFSGRCFIDLMDAVCYMHKNGLLQMDVNPSNMLYKNNRLVLFDYGIMVSLPASEEDLVLEIAFIEQAIGTLCQFNRGFHIAAKALGEPIFARLYEDANYMVHHELTIEAVENLKTTYTPWFIELFTEYGIDPTQKPLPKIAPDYVTSPLAPTGALFRRRSDALRTGFFSGEEFNIPFTDLEHYAVSNLNVNNGADGLVLKRFTEPLNDISLLTRNWLDHEDVMVARPRLDKTATFYERTYLYLDDAPLISTDNARLQKYMRKVLDGGVYDGIVVYTDYEERRPVGLLIVRSERDDATVHIKLLKINSGSVGLGVAKLLFRALLYTAKLKQTRYILVTVDQFAGVTRVFDRLGFVRRTVSGHASYALELSTMPTHYLFSHEFDAAMYHT